MKKLQYIFIVFASLLFACDSEDAFDCVKTSGETVETQIPLARFNSIRVYNNIDVIIKKGNEQKVVLTTGKNLAPKINLEVTDQSLTLINDNTCNWARSYTNPVVHITTDSLSEIILYGFGIIRSEGVLDFPTLRLESFEGPGDFYLDISCRTLRTISNDLCNMYISGDVINLHAFISANDGRFEGADLIAQNVYATHDGSNDLIVYPVKKLVAKVRSTGNIVYVNTPETLEPEITGNGNLIQR